MKTKNWLTLFLFLTCVILSASISNPLSINLSQKEILYDIEKNHADYPEIRWEDTNSPKNGFYVVTIKNTIEKSSGVNGTGGIEIFYEHLEAANGEQEYVVNPNQPISWYDQNSEGILNSDTAYGTLLRRGIHIGNYEVTIKYVKEGQDKWSTGKYGVTEYFVVDDGRSIYKKTWDTAIKKAMDLIDMPRKGMTDIILRIFYPSIFFSHHRGESYKGLIYGWYEPGYPVPVDFHEYRTTPIWVGIAGFVMSYGVMAFGVIYIVNILRKKWQ